MDHLIVPSFVLSCIAILAITLLIISAIRDLKLFSESNTTTTDCLKAIIARLQSDKEINMENYNYLLKELTRIKTTKRKVQIINNYKEK